MRWRTICLPAVASLLSAPADARVDQTLKFRPRQADGCKLIAVSPAEVSSFTAAAQAHFKKYASERFRERRLEFLRACRMPNKNGTTRLAFAIIVVSDTEAIYEIRKGEIRDAYLISYWD